MTDPKEITVSTPLHRPWCDGCPFQDLEFVERQGQTGNARTDPDDFICHMRMGPCDGPRISGLAPLRTEPRAAWGPDSDEFRRAERRRIGIRDLNLDAVSSALSARRRLLDALGKARDGEVDEP